MSFSRVLIPVAVIAQYNRLYTYKRITRENTLIHVFRSPKYMNGMLVFIVIQSESYLKNSTHIEISLTTSSI
jgi:hypothetical protein